MSVEPRRFTQLFALQVDDARGYAEYRARMTPLLEARGGAFGIDVEIARVLRAPDAASVNRLFTIEFPSQEVSRSFFADPGYRAIRAQYFEPAVSRVLALGEWGAEAPPSPAPAVLAVPG